MLNAAKGRRWREGPLAEINNSEELKAWLRKQPREVAVAFAARAVLPVLPIVQRARKGLRGKHDFLADIVLPVFRTTGVAWAVAKYPAQTTEFSAAARAAAIAAFAARDAAFAAQATADAAIAARAAANAASAARPTADATVFADRAIAAAVPAAPVTLWSAVSIDATRVGEGGAASVIAGSPLWPQGQPDRLRSLWQEMKAALHAEKQDWQVWTIWYDDRLDGHVRDEAHELAYVRIAEALWNQGPLIVNAEIKRLIEKHEPPQSYTQEPKRSPVGPSLLDGFSIPGQSHTQDPEPSPVPEIPPQRPAALEPVWSNGKLVLPSDPASTDGDPDALVAALRVLRAEIAELADDADGEANIDKRSIIYLRRKAEGIPEHAPAQDELFRLAHAKEFLEGYAKTVNEEWPDFLAQRFHALTLHFDRTVRQFSKWRAFVRNANKDRLTSERAAEVPAIADATVENLRDEDAQEFADAAIPNALESLNAPLAPAIAGNGQPLDPIEAGYAPLAEDVLESINNILKATAEGLLVCATPGIAAARGIGSAAKETAAGFASEARKSIVDEGKRLGKGTGPALTKWGKRILFGGPAIAGATAAAPSLARLLVHAFPEKFGWLQPVMDFSPQSFAERAACSAAPYGGVQDHSAQSFAAIMGCRLL